MNNCGYFLENDFLIKNLWWMIVIAVVLVGGILILLMSIRHKGNKEKKNAVSVERNLEAIGGRDNIIAHSLNGSRIVLVLKDYDLIDKQLLKSQGAIGFVLKSDKITIVFKNDAKKIYKQMFGE